ncbi:MAG TPA: PilZ domain-containing protein [Candidatus Acidoferrales bacterium]|nr:PilZ domain-containing protein [Candidatus Acidoferrales bacterium]
MSEKGTAPRRYPRRQLQKGILVAWQAAGGRHTDRAKTLGMGGLYIETSDPPAAGTYIQVLIDTKEGEVRARAAVRGSEPGRGMGVEFVGMDQAARAHLHALIKQLLA